MPVSFREAQTIVTEAHRKAAELGVSVTVVVVDEGGFVQAVGRMDGAPPLSSQIAEAKAVGAAVWHRPGDSLAAVQAERPAFFAAVDRLVRVPVMPGLGSILIRRGNAVLGAVGVSGAAPEQDLSCAEAGLGAVVTA
ncbi:MAG: heme-binding protein [Chloroflexota bacterium]|nr:heme-binding protein [Chloroflexota bacterium]